VLVLVVVGIHIDNQYVVELALNRLLAGMREEPRRVQLVDGYASTAFSKELHVLSPDVSNHSSTRSPDS